MERALSGRINRCSAEIYRAHAKNLLCANEDEGNSKAEALSHRATEIAKDQQALAWESRAATSLAQLWRNENRWTDAKELLGKVYSRFTGGFSSRDLVAARQLL